MLTVLATNSSKAFLQIESVDIPVSEKLRLLDALGETGAKVISIGSFARHNYNRTQAQMIEGMDNTVARAREPGSERWRSATRSGRTSKVPSRWISGSSFSPS